MRRNTAIPFKISSKIGRSVSSPSHVWLGDNKKVVRMRLPMKANPRMVGSFGGNSFRTRMKNNSKNDSDFSHLKSTKKRTSFMIMREETQFTRFNKKFRKAKGLERKSDKKPKSKGGSFRNRSKSQKFSKSGFNGPINYAATLRSTPTSPRGKSSSRNELHTMETLEGTRSRSRSTFIGGKSKSLGKGSRSNSGNWKKLVVKSRRKVKRLGGVKSYESVMQVRKKEKSVSFTNILLPRWKRVHLTNDIVLKFDEFRNLSSDEHGRHYRIKLGVYNHATVYQRTEWEDTITLDLTNFRSEKTYRNFKFYIVFANYKEVHMDVRISAKDNDLMRKAKEETKQYQPDFSRLNTLLIKHVLSFHSIDLFWWQTYETGITRWRLFLKILYGYKPVPEGEEREVFLMYTSVTYPEFDPSSMPLATRVYSSPSWVGLSINQKKEDELEKFEKICAVRDVHLSRDRLGSFLRFPFLKELDFHFFLDEMLELSIPVDSLVQLETEENTIIKHGLFPKLNDFRNLVKLTIRAYMSKMRHSEEIHMETQRRDSMKHYGAHTNKRGKYPEQIQMYGEEGVALIGADIVLPRLQVLRLISLPCDGLLFGSGVVVKNNLRELRELHFTKCFLFHHQVRALTYLPNLTRLWLDNCVYNEKDQDLYFQAVFPQCIRDLRIINSVIVSSKITDDSPLHNDGGVYSPRIRVFEDPKFESRAKSVKEDFFGILSDEEEDDHDDDNQEFGGGMDDHDNDNQEFGGGMDEDIPEEGIFGE